MALSNATRQLRTCYTARLSARPWGCTTRLANLSCVYPLDQYQQFRSIALCSRTLFPCSLSRVLPLASGLVAFCSTHRRIILSPRLGALASKYISPPVHYSRLSRHWQAFSANVFNSPASYPERSESYQAGKVKSTRSMSLTAARAHIPHVLPPSLHHLPREHGAQTYPLEQQGEFKRHSTFSS